MRLSAHLADDGHQIVLSSGRIREKAMIESILAPCQQAVAGGKIVSVAGELTLPQLAALGIDRAKNCFIGVDSVPMHGCRLQTPMVALFGPAKLVFWSPWQATGEIIKASDYGEQPDPDDVDTGTDERYLSPIRQTQ